MHFTNRVQRAFIVGMMARGIIFGYETAVFFTSGFELSSNVRSGANAKTESETRESRLFCSLVLFDYLLQTVIKNPLVCLA